MSGYKVVVMGATGLVGRMMLKILAERRFPVKELKLLATERSAGSFLEFQGEKIQVETTRPESFKGYDLALFSAGSSAGRTMAIEAVKHNCIVIDNSSAWRMEKDIPLVVPEVNPEVLEKHNGIIANPNCSTIQLVIVLKPIMDFFGLQKVVVSTYQAVSGSGWKAIEELKKETEHILQGEEVKPEVYPYQIAFNLLPHIDTFINDYSREELKIIHETRKILNYPELQITATTVRVPVFYGHSESVYIETIKPVQVTGLRQILKNSSGIIVYDDLTQCKYPMPFLVEEDDNVWVGRIRKDLDNDKAFHLWVVANNLRKGAATNAVQIAEELMTRGLI